MALIERLRKFADDTLDHEMAKKIKLGWAMRPLTEQVQIADRLDSATTNIEQLLQQLDAPK